MPCSVEVTGMQQGQRCGEADGAKERAQSERKQRHRGGRLAARCQERKQTEGVRGQQRRPQRKTPRDADTGGGDEIAPEGAALLRPVCHAPSCLPR
jgi:hypothetical protein